MGKECDSVVHDIKIKIDSENQKCANVPLLFMCMYMVVKELLNSFQ